MKNSMFILAAVLLSLTATAQIKVTHFPAETKFLVHMDIKQLANSKTGDLLQESMDEKSKRKVDAFKALSGIDFMKDLDSVFIVGSGSDTEKGAVYATGRFDVNKLTAILGGNDSFKSEPYGLHKILSWEDKGEVHHGCFVNSGLAVASDSVEVLKQCLDLLGGKGQALPSDSPFAAIIPAKANRFISLAAHDVNNISAENQNPQLQMLKQAQSLIFYVDQATADKADLLLGAAVSAADLETAQQMSMMIQGIQAMMMMQAAQNPEVAALAQNFKVESQDTRIRMSLKLTEDQLRKQIEEAKKKAAQAAENPEFQPAPAQVAEPPQPAVN